MSVQKGNKGQQSSGNNLGDAFRNAGYQQDGQQQGGQQQAGAQPGQAQAQPRGQGRGGIGSLNMKFRRPMSRNSAGEQVLKFRDAFHQILVENVGEDYTKSEGFRLMVLDAVSNNVPLSCILLTYSQMQGGVPHVAVYTMIVEGPKNLLSNRQANLNGQTIEIETVPGDVYDLNLWGKIEQLVRDTYGYTNMEVHDCFGMVLPNELTADDGDHLRNVLYNATNACFGVMESVIGAKEPPFSIAEIDTKSDSLIAKLDYMPARVQSAAGLPVRSDLNITLQGTVHSANSVNSLYEQVLQISSVDAFVDLVYTQPAPPQWGQPPVTQHYMPRIVLSRVDTEVDAITLEFNLLALSTATLAARSAAWMGVFRPRHDVDPKDIDIKDIGAIGNEVSIKGDGSLEPAPTKAPDFGPQALAQLLGMTVHDNPVFSMDIEEFGELSWIHTTFIAAANGDVDANQQILNAADNLTMGRFSQVYQGGPIAQDDQNRVHLGYYMVGKEARDIREIDYLAMLNLVGKDDPQLVVDWGNTFDQVDVPLEQRLERRWKLLQGVIGGTMHLKGYARRITFNPAFLEALNTACHLAGLTIRPHNMISDFGGVQQRGNPGIAQWAVNPQNTQGLFNYGAGTPQGGRMFSSPFTGRFR